MVMFEGVTPEAVYGFTLGPMCKATFSDLKRVIFYGKMTNCPAPLVRIARMLEDIQDDTGRLTLFNMHRSEEVFLDEGQESYISDLFLIAGDIRIVGCKDSFGYYPVGYGYADKVWEFARAKFKPEHDPELSEAPEGIDTFNVPAVGMF